MPKPTRDEDREHRIAMEAIVDEYNEEERALGWYYYLQDKLNFPFRAKCVQDRKISPLSVGDSFNVIGMAPEDECMHEIFVAIKWNRKTLAIPLAQLKPVEGDHDTQEGIEDWHYWIRMGYQY